MDGNVLRRSTNSSAEVRKSEILLGIHNLGLFNRGFAKNNRDQRQRQKVQRSNNNKGQRITQPIHHGARDRQSNPVPMLAIAIRIENIEAAMRGSVRAMDVAK